MKYHQLRAFVAVAETGSIRAAARSLALSQTAVTKTVQELEGGLQAPLLHRSARGVSLTPIGTELLRRAKLILAEMEEARTAIRSMLGQGTQRLNVAVTPAFSTLCLPQTLARFRKRYPDARLSIRDAFLSQVLPMLRDGTIDLAITALLPETLGSDLSFDPLGRVEIALTGRKGRFAPGPHPLSELADATWLLDMSQSGISEAVRRWLIKHRLPLPEKVIECPSSMAALVLSSETDAIAPIPRPMLALPWIQSLSEEVKLVETGLSVPFGFVLRQGRQLDATVQWFAECARRSLSTMPLLDHVSRKEEPVSG
ncbi:LysR family transcriptional regulator [Brucella intermedia]|uniref:LysR family transcriptional regulator n=1 Tax=Brucella intermedia TaxID=94625 RepID=UPI00124DB168|nr:LysR family transcriptional regulator [Brucella intermedia]KAB2711370.1 LysR family transcriptional regulator [Brucella intermedia]